MGAPETAPAEPVHESWVSWVCPTHGEALEPSASGLACPRGETFPIIGGVARFVGTDSYADAFGRQWNHFRLTQLDSHSGVAISEPRLRRILGEDMWGRLDGMTVLETGCGAGRFTDVLLARGARVVSIDLSSAVDANAETFPPSGDHAIAQADVRSMPVGRDSFDLVCGLGMIQHTPNSEQTIGELYARVKPGGWLAIDHYTWSLSRIRMGALYRLYYRRMDPEVSMPKVEALVDRWLPLHERAAGNQLTRKALSRVSPLLTYHALYPDLTPEQQREWAFLDTYDSLTDFHKHLRTRGQLVRKLERLGATEITSARAGNGVELRARKPLAAVSGDLD
jgi:SAM-dependent methyltransferase